MKVTTFVLPLLLLSMRAGAAETLSVQEFYEHCQRDEGFCLGYVGGTLDALSVISAVPGAPHLYKLCANISKSNVTYGAAKQAFMNWAPRHPELWSSGLGVGVILALQETWPCT